MMNQRPSHISTLALTLLLLAPAAKSLHAQSPNSPTPSDSASPAQKPTQKPCFNLLFENLHSHEHARQLGANSVLASSYSFDEIPKPCGPLSPVIVPVITPIVAPVNWFARFLTGPEVKPLSPDEKARLALRNLFDPFNGITILGQSGLSVAIDSHSPYGPGMPGFARNVGVSFTQDMTDQFFNTFLVPSLFHQDPHYHRMPKATIRRRIFHSALQVLWTVGDNGRGMPNYSNLIGNAIDIEISNLYVPAQQTNLPASAQRYGISLATAPIDNIITEFLPDIARRIHVKDVLIQSIINQVAKTNQTSQ